MDGQAPTFDLQSHSEYSDGELSPAGVVAAAAAAGVELLALTDHDSVDGVAEAQTAATDAGIALVPAVEISTIDPQGADLHILGYLVDTTNPELLARLERSRADRELRAARMIEAIGELGYAIDEPFLHDRVAAGQTIGRPHIAQAVVRHPRNATRLEREDLLEPSKFLVAYLIEGRPAFREREAPSVPEAIEMIHEAGGLAVWAHPFWDVDAPEEVAATVERFVGYGIDGVEAFYVTHTREQTELLADLAAGRRLLTTGSSDFHGPNHREFNRFRAFATGDRQPNLGALAARPA
jgi:3',5'-nucleoside bisphosphate phosphatase